MEQPMDLETLNRCVDYATDLYARESEVQAWIRAEMDARGLPRIEVSPLEGRILAVLASVVGARRLLEVGALGGYSALWLVSLLPAHARLVTMEKVPEHAELTREAVRRAGEEDRVEVREGDAREILGELPGEPAFDFAFIDADKENYPVYLEETTAILRPGGLLTADNTFWSGRAAGPTPEAPGRARDQEPDPATRGIRKFNRRLAEDPRFEAVILPVRDGLTVARFRG